MYDAVAFGCSSWGKKRSVENIMNCPMRREAKSEHNRRDDIDDVEGSVALRGKLCTGVTEP